MTNKKTEELKDKIWWAQNKQKWVQDRIQDRIRDIAALQEEYNGYKALEESTKIQLQETK